MDSVDYYNKYANSYFNNTVDLDMGDTLECFLEHFEAGDTILDLGCGSGRDGKIMLEHDLEVTFLDASEELCQLADIYTGIEPLCMDFRKIDFDSVFDGIWACASLLHISKKELPEVLCKIRKALKPGGIFYMSVKEGDFEGFRQERYFADYNSKELLGIIKQIPEYEVLDLWTTVDIRTNRTEQRWINVLLQNNSEK